MLLQVNLPMEVRKVVADPHVADDIGKVALQRGPLIYCAEWADNNGMATDFILPENMQFSTEFRKDLLNGVTVMKSEAIAVVIDDSGLNVTTVNTTLYSDSILRLGTPWKRRNDDLVS